MRGKYNSVPNALSKRKWLNSVTSWRHSVFPPGSLSAGADLSEFFNCVYTTAPIDYDKYLGYAGLRLEVKEGENGRRIYSIKRGEELDGRQLSLLNGWL